MGKYILLAILITILLGTAFLTYRRLTYSERMEQYGYELMQKIDAYKAEHGHYPKELNIINGVEVDFECNHYKGGIFYYTLANDSTYWLEYPLDAENNRGMSSANRIWTEDYVIYRDLDLNRLIFRNLGLQRNH